MFGRKKKKILLIEDEPDMATVITERLHKEDLEVITIGEGKQGVEMAQKDKPDLIILDLILPLGDGLWVLQRLKELPKTMHIPVIVLTASGDDKYIKKVTDLGIEAFMRKPYKGDKLVETVNKILRKG